MKVIMFEQRSTESLEDYDIVTPEPGALIESLRAFGYTPQAAIADLIDNSITAGAKKIWVNFFWSGEHSYVTIRDDGRGMTPEELISAMRAGSQNPLKQRSSKDLGRFGLGLKTASFSQCRMLTVASKISGSLATTKRWDLDYVGQMSEWRLLHGAAPGSDSKIAEIVEQKSGTLILWELMDRLTGNTNTNDQKAQKRFYSTINAVEEHLSMVFHRFLESPQNIAIYINNSKINAWDPFLKNEDATQHLPEELLQVHGTIIKVRPYVLPHHSKLSPEVHKRAAGPNGWNAQQGFYVYRNQRLLLAGDWLRLGFQKEEHYKLARIVIDLPNSMDQEWDIDVRKSRARPPGYLHDDLRRIAHITRERAVNVYRHRGKVLARQISENNIFVWNQELKHGHVAFRINREQPLVAHLLQSSQEQSKKIEAILRLIEEALPISLIAPGSATQPDTQLVPFEDAPSSEVLDAIKPMYALLRECGMSPTQAKEQLVTIEPFLHFKELVMSLHEDEI